MAASGMHPKMTQVVNGMETFQKQLLVSDARSNKNKKEKVVTKSWRKSFGSKQICRKLQSLRRSLSLFCFRPAAANDRLSRDRRQQNSTAGTDRAEFVPKSCRNPLTSGLAGGDGGSVWSGGDKIKRAKKGHGWVSKRDNIGPCNVFVRIRRLIWPE